MSSPERGDKENRKDSSNSRLSNKTESPEKKGFGQAGDKEPKGHSDRASETVYRNGTTWQRVTPIKLMLINAMLMPFLQ